MNKECCEKCHDVYFEKDYPAHTAIDACNNPQCECHSNHSPKAENVCALCLKGNLPHFECNAELNRRMDSPKAEWELDFQKQFPQDTNGKAWLESNEVRTFLHQTILKYIDMVELSEEPIDERDSLAEINRKEGANQKVDELNSLKEKIKGEMANN